MLALVTVLFIVYWQLMGKLSSEDVVDMNDSISQYEASSFDESHDPLIPIGPKVEVVKHQHYSLGYVERYEQAAWVSYRLTKKSLQIPNVPRADRFEEDRSVSTGSAHYYDYRGSGYSRGHMAPAGDMAFDKEAMEASFLMSNMSPQKIGFNGGIWRELEETVRDWAYDNDEVYIVTGPVLNNVTKYVGDKSKVGVPDAYYKVILDNKGAKKAIGFIMPNEVSEQPIMSYAMTVDEVERVVGIDFYANLLDDGQEGSLEASIDPGLWRVSIKRQENRINNWNKNN